MSTYYDVLGLERSASTREIERRYRLLAKQHHPDLNPGVNPLRMEEINEAWEVLGDPYRRAAYDRQLGVHASAGQGKRAGADADVDLTDLGFVEWRGWMPRVPATGRNLWAKGAHSLEPLRLLNPDSVWGLHLAGCGVDDTDMALLAGMPAVARLRVLDLSETAVTDLGLAEVAKLTHLEDLALWGTAVTDVGVGALRGLQRLVSLNLGATHVTDAAIESLTHLSALRMVNLRSTAVTATGLVRLAALPTLSLVGVPRLGWRDRVRIGRVLRNRLT